MWRVRMLLYFLTAFNVGITYATIRYTTPPYTVITVIFVLLVDLLLRSPLKYAAAAACNASREIKETKILHKATLRKAITLQLWLWKTRLWRYAAALLPAVCIEVLSNRLYLQMRASYDPQVVSAVTAVFSHILLLAGIMTVEIFMFRFMAVWYLLPHCTHAKQAVQWAKSLSIYRMEEVVELCLHTPAFSVARAAWVARQANRSKHAYNFLKTTKTVTGTMNAENTNDGGWRNGQPSEQPKPE